MLVEGLVRAGLGGTPLKVCVEDVAVFSGGLEVETCLSSCTDDENLFREVEGDLLFVGRQYAKITNPTIKPAAIRPRRSPKKRPAMSPAHKKQDKTSIVN